MNALKKYILLHLQALAHSNNYTIIMISSLILLNSPNATCLYSLKTSENLKVFWCFQGIQKGYIESKWVKKIHKN